MERVYLGFFSGLKRILTKLSRKAALYEISGETSTTTSMQYLFPDLSVIARRETLEVLSQGACIQNFVVEFRLHWLVKSDVVSGKSKKRNFFSVKHSCREPVNKLNKALQCDADVGKILARTHSSQSFKCVLFFSYNLS